MSKKDEDVSCLRCGRKLKDPRSIERGMGRTCWKKHKAALYKNCDGCRFLGYASINQAGPAGKVPYWCKKYKHKLYPEEGLIKRPETCLDDHSKVFDNGALRALPIAE